MKNLFNNLIICIISAIFIISLYNLYKIYNEYKSNKDTYREVVDIVENDDNISIKNEEYNKLKEINKDYIFWIYIPNTNINYPVIKPRNNDEYLYKNFKGEENKGGSIFIDSKNTLEDDNIIVYGHNMKDKSMFGTLSKFLESDFINDNKKIYIYLENEILEYEIFSVYITNGDSFPYKINFKDSQEFSSYIDILMNKSIHNLNYYNDGNRNIITLSTCTNATGEERTVVNAKLKNIVRSR